MCDFLVSPHLKCHEVLVVSERMLSCKFISRRSGWNSTRKPSKSTANTYFSHSTFPRRIGAVCMAASTKLSKTHIQSSLLQLTSVFMPTSSRIISKSVLYAPPRQFYSRTASTTPEQLTSDLKTTASKINDGWNEWEKAEDDFEKRTKGKELIQLYATLQQILSALSKDEAQFEHLAALHSVDIVQTYYRLGLVHAQRLDYEKSVEHLQKCVTLDPTNYNHYMKFGEVLYTARMYGSAVQAYTTIMTTLTAQFKKAAERPHEVPRPDSYNSHIFNHIELRPKIQYPHSKIAEVLFRRGLAHLASLDNELALADWKNVIGLESNHRTAESYAYLAHLARLHGKWQQTIDLCSKALEYDSELLFAFYERSIAHYVLKNEGGMKADNRSFAILAHEKMWGLSNHPVQPDWGPEE
jgi:tetratricopeptide (TPR) repeat protein